MTRSLALALLLAVSTVLAAPARGQSSAGPSAGVGASAGSAGPTLSGVDAGVAVPGGDAGGAAPPSVRPGVTDRDPGALGRLVLPGAVDPDTYRIGPGDVFVLSLWGGVSNTVMLEVGAEGTVLLPGAGSLQVSGLTLRDAREAMLRRMREGVRRIQMDVRLMRPRTFHVDLTGQVRAPGPVEATAANRVADVLSPDQLLPEASRRNIRLQHKDGTRELADLDRFLMTGDLTDAPYLRDGDIVHVPSATEFVYVHGAVARPGRFELGPRDSLRTLLRLAGDPLPSADANRVLLVRWAEPYLAESLWTGLGDIYSRQFNPPMRDGDRLYLYFIPRYHLQHEVTIVGEVRRPGTYPILEGHTRLSDLMEACEGFLPGADLSAVRVHRRGLGGNERDPELDRLLRLSRSELTSSEYDVLRTRLAGMREDYRVDGTRLQSEKGRDDVDVLMRDGDVVRVERLVSSIRVDGEVRSPAILTYVPGLVVHDYIRQAGGFSRRAWTGKIRITRAVTGQTLLARDVRTLGPGDFVWVPEKPDRTAWEQSREVLTALASVATIVIAIRSVR